jgi:hypothetical protein
MVMLPPKKLPTIERKRAVVPRTIAYPCRVRAEVTIELLRAILSGVTMTYLALKK